MRKIILALLLASPSFLFSENVSITQVGGSVQYKINSASEWQSATQGTEVPEGGSVQTGADGRAIIRYPNKSTVWLKENTNLEFEKRHAQENQISLGAGSIKVRIPHLKRKEYFHVRTGNAVAAVRGTVFTAELTELRNQPIINVLFGEVNINKIEGPTGEEVLAAKLSQGISYSQGETRVLTREEEVKGLENWSPGLTTEQRLQELKEQQEKRLELALFASGVRETIRDGSAFREQLKEEDFAAGRTLTDVHGNLVRVDQRLQRPDDKTLQAVNVVKRLDYKSGGLRKYTYGGAKTGVRLDVMIGKIEVNNPLPEKISDFPAYFDGKDNKLEKTALILASNIGSANQVFTIGFFGKRDAGKSEIDPDLYIGTLAKGDGFGGEFRNVYSLTIDDNKNVAGLTRFTRDTTVASDVSKGTYDGKDGMLYGNLAERYQLASNTTQKIWLAGEAFVIDNGGSIRKVSDFTDATNLESLLKSSSGQFVAFIKQADGNGNLDKVNDETSSSVFAGGNSAKNNIDVVVISDVAVSTLKTLVTGLGKISDGFKQ